MTLNRNNPLVWLFQTITGARRRKFLRAAITRLESVEPKPLTAKEIARLRHMLRIEECLLQDLRPRLVYSRKEKA